MAPFAHIAGLRWRYSVGDWVLRDIQLDIEAGERVGLVGRSGSGKSSLALTFNGIIPQSYAGQMGGQVVVAGHVTATTLVAEMAREVAMVFQSPDDQMSHILVRHEVASGPANLGLPLSEVLLRTTEALCRLAIEHLAERETASLSGGEKQKVALAAALAMHPRLLVLDEPTTDLDPLAKADLVATLGALDPQTTMVIVSHDLETIAPLVDRLVIVDAGAIVADAPARELLGQPALLTAHGIAATQLAVLNAALDARYADWSPAASASDLAARLTARGVVQSRATEVPPGPPAMQPGPPSAPPVPAVQLDGVTFRYPDAPGPAADNVSLSIATGELVAIIGHNGSGKTTLSKLILGLLKPTHGTVRVLGQPVDRIRPDCTGYIYQNPDAMLSQMSVREEVAFTPKQLGRAAWLTDTQRMLETFGLDSLENRFPLSLSKGQRQRLAYAAVTAAGPPILIFDEPTTGIDQPGCDQIMQYMDELRKQHKTILFITHDMALAVRWSDRVMIMHDGQLVHEGPTDTLHHLDQARLAAYHLKLPLLSEVARRLGLAGRVATPAALLERLQEPATACGG